MPIIMPFKSGVTFLLFIVHYMSGLPSPFPTFRSSLCIPALRKAPLPTCYALCFGCFNPKHCMYRCLPSPGSRHCLSIKLFRANISQKVNYACCENYLNNFNKYIKLQFVLMSYFGAHCQICFSPRGFCALHLFQFLFSLLLFCFNLTCCINKCFCGNAFDARGRKRKTTNSKCIVWR